MQAIVRSPDSDIDYFLFVTWVLWGGISTYNLFRLQTTNVNKYNEKPSMKKRQETENILQKLW